MSAHWSLLLVSLLAFVTAAAFFMPDPLRPVRRTVRCSRRDESLYRSRTGLH
jgi:hypothetical protein